MGTRFSSALVKDEVGTARHGTGREGRGGQGRAGRGGALRFSYAVAGKNGSPTATFPTAIGAIFTFLLVIYLSDVFVGFCYEIAQDF